MSAYERFAKLYDSLMDDLPYPQWSDFIDGKLKKLNKDKGHILDLACGTGTLTLLMAEKGYSIEGSDLSEDMLMQAEQKSREEGFSIDFYKQDMREFFPIKQPDIVLCSGDGLNYMSSQEDLKKVFMSVYRALADDGIFIFDMNMPYRFKTQYGNECYHVVEDDHAYIWINTYDEDTHTNAYDLTFFVLDDQGLYERFEEYHEEYGYEANVIIQMLMSIGFTIIETLDSYKDAPLIDETLRGTFIVKK